MPIWIWQGRDRHGRWCRGRQSAPAAQALLAQLEEEGVTVLHRRHGWFGPSSPPHGAVVWLLRQWATLLEAGVPLVGGLDVLASDPRGRALGPVVEALRRQLECGLSLAAALSRHPCFDASLCLAAAAGEQTGRLGLALERWAALQDARLRVRARVRAALLYPGLVLAMALLLVAVMLLTVVPVFRDAFAVAGRELPAPTRALLWLSDRAQAPGALAAGLLLLPGLPAAWLQRWPRWLYRRERLLLRLPWVGPVLHQAALARWSRTFALLLAAGVPVLEAIGPACLGCENRSLAAAGGGLCRRLQAGSSLHDAMHGSGCFTPLLLQMVRVGETSGTLDRMCVRAAEHFERETEQATLTFTALLEPLAMGLLGGLCALLLWALYLPVFQLGDILA